MVVNWTTIVEPNHYYFNIHSPLHRDKGSQTNLLNLYWDESATNLKENLSLLLPSWQANRKPNRRHNIMKSTWVSSTNPGIKQKTKKLCYHRTFRLTLENLGGVIFLMLFTRSIVHLDTIHYKYCLQRHYSIFVHALV